jgi:hypothetical protein
MIERRFNRSSYPARKVHENPLSHFVRLQNVKRYRELLDVVSDETQRRQILNLLGEEEHSLEKQESTNVTTERAGCSWSGPGREPLKP